MADLVHAIISSPLGPLHLAATDEGLVHMLFEVQVHAPPTTTPAAAHPILAHAARELDAYFAGSAEPFTVPLAPRGTDFQCAVWRALVAIPHGDHSSYRDVARALDKVGSERAVGNANGKNRIGIIVPCHRVIGSNGALTGYAAGLDKKRWLLTHEARVGTRDLFEPQV